MPVKAMEHSITQVDSNITAANGTAAVMSDIYTYKVPRHTAIQIRPEDTLSAYLKDAGAEAVANDPFELVIRDPNSLTVEVLAMGSYLRMKEFTDRNKILRLGISKLIKSDYSLILRVKATTVLVVSTCYFQITCLRYAEVL
jgi:hypothetical protein